MQGHQPQILGLDLEVLENLVLLLQFARPRHCGGVLISSHFPAGVPGTGGKMGGSRVLGGPRKAQAPGGSALNPCSPGPQHGTASKAGIPWGSRWEVELPLPSAPMGN